MSKLGSWEFIETLISKISLREGFGDALAAGIDHAAEQVGSAAKGLVENAGIVGEAGYNQPYGPRLYSTTGLFWATETRWPVYLLHEVSNTISKWVTWRMMGFGYSTPEHLRATAKLFWGSEAAADFSTYEGKALAAKMIQDRNYAKECLVLCDWLWPIMDLEFTEDHLGDPTMESQLVSAVTGKEVDKEGLDRIGERVFNLQRAILVREGHRGRAFDTLPERTYTVPLEWDVSNPQCVVPGSEGEPISRKGAVVDREEFERMKDEYYQLRQWDVATGLQTRAGLEKLGLEDVAQDLEQRGLITPLRQAKR
jgi:aldehyde:ferredoxin oxidoreductase